VFSNDYALEVMAMRISGFTIRTRILGLFLVVICVFSALIFFWILPTMKMSLYKEKQTQLQSLVQTVSTQLAEYHAREQRGEFSREEAQSRASMRIKSLRYGMEGKDYFWINDFTPKMVMHPHRPDLDGTDLSNYKDPLGKALFVEFVKVCQAKNEGFVEYMWQWKDDKNKIVPKISYVKAFAPWGWIVGTGFYINDVTEQISELRNKLILVVIPLILALLALLYLPMRRLGRIVQVAQGIDQISEEVKTGATQVAKASHSLAGDASEQAASLEETSASLEEVTSMTRQNTDNAGQAKAQMAEAQLIVQKVSNHMAEMTKAIEEISRSSEETGKIIKSIDEIAFQTNLLALNAAVEAARAGEAGAGFAVVADEVRNLAMRAAEAAKNTSNLIEKTIKAVRNGNDLTKLTQEAFGENMSISTRIAQLVDEIASASQEQAHGINQINTAVAEIDKVTQQVAASAEESASAAEEMSAQAEQMKSYVGDLMTVIGGGVGNHTGGERGGAPRPLQTIGKAGTEPLKPSARPNDQGKGKNPLLMNTKTFRPQRVIQRDDKDMRDF
jgi:methyl-accepting chemotaxis protein